MVTTVICVGVAVSIVGGIDCVGTIVETICVVNAVVIGCAVCSVVVIDSICVNVV